jgi:lipopolysaccharide transport system ATP-binding protein
MDPIIKIENLSKQYRLGTIGTGTLRNDIKRWWYSVRGKEDPFFKIGDINDRSVKGSSEYVWALKDINLDIMPGEVLGIIGKNGAGKSTLLKILSKVTGPTTGKIHFNGRIGSLLEVGTGFHPELTGRENILLNGAILGMTKAEIRNKLDEIIDFSGCERYIDTPVKRYSSGMTVRLGFAVAAHLEPEILVVDEVLAVGDAEFQKKAIGKMQDVSRNNGRTVLFVSHNMASISKLCTSALVIEDGKSKYNGDTETAIDLYMNANIYESNTTTQTKFERKHESRYYLIKRVAILNEENLPASKFYTGNTLKVEIYNHEIDDYILKNGYCQLNFHSKKSNERIFTLLSDIRECKFNFIKSSRIVCEVRDLRLTYGEYYIGVELGVYTNRREWLDYVENAISFKVELGSYLNGIEILPGQGYIAQRANWVSSYEN